MIRCIMAVFALISSNAIAKDYWTAEEYFSLHPEQRELSEALRERAKKPVDPVLKKYVSGLNVHIIAVEPSEQISDYWVKTRDAIETRLLEYDVLLRFERKGTRHGQEAIMVRNILASLDEYPDFLMLSAENNRMQSLLALLLKDVPQQKIIVNNLTTPIRFTPNQPFLYAGFDHFEGGKLIGEFYRDKGYSNVLAICLKRGFVAEQRLQGFESGLGGYVDDVLHFNGDSESLLSESEYIRSKVRTVKPDAIFACASDIALTLANMELGKVLPINGIGGVTKELAAFEKGKLAVVSDRVGNIGIAIADAIALSLAEKKSPLISIGHWELVSREYLFSSD